jgi:hypothetical protein
VEKCAKNSKKSMSYKLPSGNKIKRIKAKNEAYSMLPMQYTIYVIMNCIIFATYR